MSFTKFNKYLKNISVLPDEPRQENGYSAQAVTEMTKHLPQVPTVW